MDDFLAGSARDPVSHRARIAVTTLQAGLAKSLITVAPPVKCRLRDSQFVQGPLNALMGMLYQTDDFEFSDVGYLILGRTHAQLCFFEQPVLQHLLGHSLLQITRLGTKRCHLIGGGLACRNAG